MIAVWMLYCVGIGLAFVIVGHALERGLHLAGRATRWAWVIAIVGSYLVPVAAWLRPEAFATFAAPIPVVFESGPSLGTSTTSTNLDQPPPSDLSLADLDSPLRWGWGLASVTMLFVLAVAVARLLSQRRHWRQAVVDGRLVLVSRNIGPAVVGVWGPRVVLPEWALQLPEWERELMLAHEEQHVRAADPALIAMGLALVLLAPWNVALWWQWRRLRLAVEMDCDARVLGQGRPAAAYGELLLSVGRRRSAQMLGMAAFGEPASFLESRIRRMLAGLPRWRWVGAGAAALVALAAIIVACETPRPIGPTAYTAEPARAAPADIELRQVLTESVVDERPDFLSGPQLVYPELLRRAGVEGRVLLQAIIDTMGRAEPASVKVISSPNPGFDESAKQWILRTLFRPGRVHGRAVRVLINLPCDFKIHGGPSDTERLRSWVESNARRMMPAILEPSGPPMDAFLVHDSRLKVYQGSLTTLDYLGPGGSRPRKQIDVAEVQRALPSFNPGHDGWAVIDPRGLRGLVRDNVRVIRINHNPQPHDTVPGTPGALDSAEVIRRAEQVRRLARQYHPEVFGRGTAPTAVALVMDARGSVLGHAARTRYARGADVRTVDGVVEDYLEVLTRLVPRFKDAQWLQSGYTNDSQPNVVIYWGIVLHP
ncbi:MAG: hypothetical protein DMD58_07635 [Gemmatimonadetes bacterium]|nr:MAG: hypothetical protein DMD58_07635 [Gemmatimonadota bacterium]